MVFVKTRRLFKYMHSQWTRIHCSDGSSGETPKALYYNHLPAAYLTFASPSVFVFVFVLVFHSFVFQKILFELNSFFLTLNVGFFIFVFSQRDVTSQVTTKIRWIVTFQRNSLLWQQDALNVINQKAHSKLFYILICDKPGLRCKYRQSREI